MNVLTVNKYYYEKGGSETYLFALEEELKKRGINVFPFSMKDKKNRNAITSKYFVNNVDYNNANFIQKIDLSLKIVFSMEAYKKIDSLLEDYKIDVAHLNIFQHQLSPSILYPLKKRNIPVVYTVHDLKMLCPNYKMLTHGEVCERCKGGKYYNSLLNKCTKGSILGSAVNMFEAYVHRFLKTYEKKIDVFITPSLFYKKKMIEWGVRREKIHHIPNFVDPQKFVPNYSNKGYFLYFGRLSEEKGILTLIHAMNFTKHNTKLKIVGTGPLKEDIERLIKESNLNDNIELLGFKSGKELNELIENSKAVVLPSEWYENGPLSIIESFAYGKPVIGSNIGGIPEHIDDNVNGWIFEPKNYKELTHILDKVNKMKTNELNILGKNARAKVERIYNEKFYMEKLMNIYQSLIDKGEEDH